MHYENEQDKERLLKVTIGGHPNGTLMVANDKVAEALEGEFKPCCFFGAMIYALYDAEQEKNTS